MTDYFKVDTDVPFQTSNISGELGKYPLDELDIGNSFLVPYEDGKEKAVQATSLRGRLTYWTETRKSKNSFAIRRTNDGLRVWRTA